MRRVVIFGNSGSGKSTLASEKANILGCSHMDLDTVTWKTECTAPTRKTLSDSQKQIDQFLASSENWIIEGCYSDLLELVTPHCTEIIFLNPGTETCVTNCKNRPWEPHKYDSQEAQDANLEMLLTWVEQYTQRTDEFSLQAHRKIFDDFVGVKQEYLSNQRSE